MWSRIRGAPRVLLLLAMAIGAALIAVSSLVYLDFDELPPFVIERLPVRFESLWLLSLRAHVFAATVAFPLSIVLMTRALQRRAVLHRWLGRLASALVLGAVVPSGAVLAFEAKGGAFVTAGFLVSGALVAWFMVEGIRTARRRDLVAHRRAMMHVFAQMSVAVTSRALLLAFDVVGIDPDVAYVVALWGPVTVSAALAEGSELGRIVHVFDKVAPFLHARSLARGRSVARVGR